MESSRVFVRGLPSNLALDDFRKHFAQQSPITDAKFIPHRRIGYVGYKTHEDAKRAVKYHNKTYIRMSRINAELARSVGQQSTLRASLDEETSQAVQFYQSKTNNDNASSMQDRSYRKRKQDDVRPSQDDKLQEFLDVMQPPSKSKTWENQDRHAVHPLPPDLANEGQASVENDSEADYEHVPKKRKTPKTPTIQETNEVITQIAHSERAEHARRGEPDSAKVLEQESLTISAGSDADWLRSRTSRLLGLADDVESRGSPAPAMDVEMETNARLSQSKGLQSSSASEMTEKEFDQHESAVAGQIREEVAVHTTGNGRLFIRNLTYTVTEEDLRRHFESSNCGTIEEVSAFNLYILK